MANENISIIISAILKKTTEQELIVQLKNIEKKIKPLDLKINTKSAEQSAKVFEQYYAKIDNALSKSASNRIKETEQLTSKQGKAINQVLEQTYKQTEAEKKKTIEIEKQIALYKQQKSVQLQNLSSQYGQKIYSSGSSDIANLQSGISSLNVGNFNEQSKVLNQQLSQIGSNFKKAKAESEGFSGQLSKNAIKMMEWVGLGTLIFGTFREIKEGISYIIELDNSLNEIRIVTNKTTDEVDRLAKSYNKLAKEMNVTTREIASQAADLYRQGLNDTQVEERMKGIIQYAKISSISLSDSNKIITATANATGESIQKIIDVFAILGDSTASGADEIGEALQRVASASENSNISLEKSSSWLATISSVTRESASTIGRSLNSIISRYESIKAKGFNEEDATKINDVTKALSSIKINPTVNGQLRDITEVLDELGGRWEGLTKNEKAYIATTLAGTFQRNRLITLMNNYGDSLKNYETALNSAGVAEQKFAIYQESSAAKMDKAKASIEGFWQNVIDSDSIKLAIDGFSTLINIFDKLFNNSFSSAVIQVALLSASIYGLGFGIGKLSSLILGSNFGLKFVSMLGMMTSSTIGLNVGIKALTTTMLASPLFWIVAGTTAVYGIVKAVDILTISVEEQKQKVEELTSKYSSLTTELQKLKDIKDPSESQKLQIKLLERELELQTALLKIEKEKLMNKEVFGEGVFGGGEEESINESIRRVKNYYTLIEEYKKDIASGTDVEWSEQNLNEVYQDLTVFENKLLQSRKVIQGFVDIMGVNAPESLKTLLASIDSTLPKLQQMNGSLQSNSSVAETLSDSTFNLADSYTKMTSSIKDTSSDLKDLNQTIADIKDGQSLSSDTVLDLIEKYNLSTDAIKKTSDGYTIELSALENVRQAKIQTAIDSINNEIKITDVTKTQIEARLKNYGLEIEGLKNIAKVKSILSRQAADNVTGGSMDAGIWTGVYSQANKDLQALEDIEKLHEKAKTMETLLSDKSYGVSNNKSKSKKDPQLSDVLKKEQEYLNKITEAENKSKSLTNEEYDIRLKNLKVEESAQKALLKYYESQRGVAKSKGLEDELNEKILKTQGDLANIEKERKNINSDIVKQKEEEKKKQEELIKKQQELLKKQQEYIQKSNDEKIKAYEDYEKTITTLLKKKYDNEKKEEEERHKDVVDNLDDELKKRKEYVDKVLDEMDRLYDTEDYNKNIIEQSDEILKIKNEINKYSMATSSGDMDAISKVNELKKELADKEATLQETQTKRSRDLIKESLQDNLSNYEKNIESQKDLEEKKYEENKDRLDSLTDETSLKLEAQKILAQENITNVQDSINNLFKITGENATITGQILQSQIIDKLNQLKDIQNNLGSITGKSSGNNPLGMNREDFAIYLANKKAAKEGTATEAQKKQNSDLRKAHGIATDDFSYDQLSGYYDDGGEARGIGLLAKNTIEPERVLSPVQTTSFNKLVDMLPNLVPNFMNNFRVPQPQFNMSGVGVNGGINISMPISVAGNLDKAVLPDLKNMISSVIKTELNRNGVTRR